MYSVNNDDIKQSLDINLEFKIECNGMYLILDEPNSKILTFLDDENFIESLLRNSAYDYVFTTKEIGKKISNSIKCIIVEDPRYSFFTLLNYINKKHYKKIETSIHESAQIHETAYISPYNVEIGENVIVEPNVTILPDTVIKKGCIIHAGAVISPQGSEQKQTSKGILTVFHESKSIINENVEVGANACIHKGFLYKDTIIGANTKLDNLVYIAHRSHIGERCVVMPNAVICGSTIIGDDVRVGANSTISNLIKVGNNADITIGAVVTKDVPNGSKVSGNFAIQHSKLISFIKSIR